MRYSFSLRCFSSNFAAELSAEVGTLTLPAEMRPRWEPMLGSVPEPWRVLPGKDTKYGQSMKIPMFTVIANSFRSGLYSIFSIVMLNSPSLVSGSTIERYVGCWLVDTLPTNNWGAAVIDVESAAMDGFEHFSWVPRLRRLRPEANTNQITKDQLVFSWFQLLWYLLCVFF